MKGTKEKSKMNKIQRRYICLTYSQCPATPEEMLDHFKKLWGEEKIVYVLIGQEHHELEGLHLHCYVELNKKIRVPLTFFAYKKDGKSYSAKVKEAFAKGNKAGEGKFGWFDYIRKEGFKIIEFGTPPVPTATKPTKKEINAKMKGGNNEIMSLVDDGVVPLKDLPRWLIGLQAYNSLKPYEKDYPKEVRWYYGTTGTGKSRKAWDDAKASGSWFRKSLKDWFDGYSGQNYVWIDEIRSTTFDWEFFLQLIDRYPLDVGIKGGSVRWTPKVIIITAPSRPEKIFMNHKSGETWDKIDQVLRRITVIRDFDEQPYNPSPDVSEEEANIAEAINHMEEELAEARNTHDNEVLVAHPIPVRLPSLHESLNHMVEDSSLTDLELTPTWESDK